MATEVSTELSRHRLSRADYAPWTHAERLEDCFLFWLPVQAYPMTHGERQWLTHFLLRLAALLEKAESLRCEIFVPYKLLVDDTLTKFVKYRQKSPTLMGLERRLNASLPVMPSQAEVDDLKKSGVGLDYRKWTADYTYWFVAKQPEQQRALSLAWAA